MKPLSILRPITVLIAMLVVFNLQASDMAKEKRWADQNLQIKVAGADHFFKGKSDILVKQVDAWIKQYRQ